MEWIISRSTTLQARTLGIVCIIFAVFLLSLSDAMVKAAGDSFGLGQFVFLRSLIAGLAIATAIRMASPAMRPYFRLSVWVGLRSLCLTAMWLCYYAALPSMSFGLAAACYYSSPAWMAVMSHFVLKERLGARQWGAVLLTLCGVVLAVFPDAGGLPPVTLLPLLAGLFYALAAVVTRSRCGAEAPMAMALNLNVTLVVASGMGLLGLALFNPAGPETFTFDIWPPLTAEDLLLVGLLGLFLSIIATAVAQAYKLAPSPVVGVFDNTYLLFAALWSLVLLGEMPSLRELGGMALIGAGACLASRKRAAGPEHLRQ
jgi:drug/metabolite transporter (DMT)-like permease